MSESVAVIEARRQALRRLAHESAIDAMNARVQRRRAQDEDDHRVQNAHATEHEKKADKSRAKLEAMADHHGTTAEDALEDVKDERRENLQQQLEQWYSTRDVHKDMVENPDLYGGCDLGGRPLNMEQQKYHIKQYDVAIDEAEKELEELG